MVGFNRGDGRRSDAHADQFTFHYGRIQSKRGTQTLTWDVIFTFHYGRIQSRARRVPTAAFLNLHSIMVGFNLVILRIFYDGVRIYIPLWSDSILCRIVDAIRSARFTFHYGRIQSSRVSFRTSSRCWFTFHYGRIQSFRPRSRCTDRLSFTFHYGRIQSRSRRGRYSQARNLHSIMVGFNLILLGFFFSAILHLHSIMVGFNRKLTKTTTSTLRIYIPLWSDSIEKDKTLTELLLKFTFHYGRIQSTSLVW